MRAGGGNTDARTAKGLTKARGTLVLLGPAFVAAVAYVDPGNVATNVTAGARFGYLLLWVVVLANVTAVLVQYLAAKVTIATGRTLPELCNDTYPRPVRVGLVVQAELVAIATDLAEVVGGAIALYLLVGMPLLLGGVVTGAVSWLCSWCSSTGARSATSTRSWACWAWCSSGSCGRPSPALRH